MRVVTIIILALIVIAQVLVAFQFFKRIRRITNVGKIPKMMTILANVSGFSLMAFWLVELYSFFVGRVGDVSYLIALKIPS